MRFDEQWPGRQLAPEPGEEGRAAPPLVVLVGPTAVGKTEISLRLAKRLGGEIVSADARLFYRGMDIGTAKPNLQERQQVPHHLIDVADPDESWSLALFQRAARQAIAGILARGRMPLLVGGSGQYVRAVLEGWQVPAQGPDRRLREALESWAGRVGAEGLHARLAAIDPPAAARIQPRNLRRTVRALEVIFSTGRRFSEQAGRGEPPYRALILGLTRPRPELYARIDARIQTMMAAGLADEVRRLLAQGYSPQLPTMSAIGYQEMVQTLNGEINLEEAVTLMKRRTRQFVRRQANWFKVSDPHIHWFRVGEGTVDEMEGVIRAWL
jgi:tRNA dimethylallyltransferase